MKNRRKLTARKQDQLFENADRLFERKGQGSEAVQELEVEEHVTPPVLRHTYGSVRIQTLDRGEPVALFTVARELGHSGVKVLEERQEHLLSGGRRLPFVEYRFEEHDRRVGMGGSQPVSPGPAESGTEV